MKHEQLRQELLSFVEDSYPEMKIVVESWAEDPSRTAIYFTESKFSLLYPLQRYHYLTHLIPRDFNDAHLSNSVWFELAPGETPEDLVFPDEEWVQVISSDVLGILAASKFFESLDDAMSPGEQGAQKERCWGDFRHSRRVLLEREFTDEQLFDAFHVLMDQGAFCDCEVLYNAAPASRLALAHWEARAAEEEPPNPHARK